MSSCGCGPRVLPQTSVAEGAGDEGGLLESHRMQPLSEDELFPLPPPRSGRGPVGVVTPRVGS